MLKKMFDEVNFEIEKEGWNEYEVVDGHHRVTLKMRVILTKILRPKILPLQQPPLIGIPKEAQSPNKVPKDEFQLSFQNIVVVSNCPAENMGTPTQPLPPNELDQAATEEVEFSTFNEEWNIYVIPDSGLKLKIKLVVSSVRKANGHYDQFGYPIYVVQSANVVVPIPPKQKK
jgi:hypothetical protein